MSAAISALYTHLREPAVRRGLVAMVRRRVPEGDAEDVVQAVLCDALAAPNVPASQGEIPRWLVGIARHKVADFHRRARRETRAADADEIGREAPVDACIALEQLVAETCIESRQRETLEWIVREHAGEPLADIAREARLPAPTVRQRVSRMRRALQARWAVPLALVLALGAGGSLARFLAGSPAQIVAEPSAGPHAAALARLQGEWRVAGADVRVRIVGARVIVDGPGVHAERAITIGDTRSDGDALAITATLHEASSKTVVRARLEGNRLVVDGVERHLPAGVSAGEPGHAILVR